MAPKGSSSKPKGSKASGNAVVGSSPTGAQKKLSFNATPKPTDAAKQVATSVPDSLVVSDVALCPHDKKAAKQLANQQKKLEADTPCLDQAKRVAHRKLSMYDQETAYYRTLK